MSIRPLVAGAVTFFVAAVALLLVSSAAGLIVADYEFLTVLAIAAVAAIAVAVRASRS